LLHRKDYGPQAAFWKLDGRCFELTQAQYRYSVCPYGAARQDHTSLGSFTGWGGGAVPDYRAMSFTGGAVCWNGPARSFTLFFECGTEERLLGVDEPSKCTYVGRLTTPAACDAAFAAPVDADLGGRRDEL
jgi:protein kinase C substrate 80K-H